ncbi:FliM/FliN family flagellar motor switch protein [Tabrizicola sp. BL-A-41-H6]|uniref:FliM/FliN family flagellar motor switch protein n=1 Tax=Tabrizicola sp. BL-A-41-H6 TaxID=3421107 RepID=UPI003D677F29
MSDVIRRKIDRAEAAQQDGAPGADRGWRLALARAARNGLGLDVEFRRMSVRRTSLAELLELPPDRALLALLDGPEAGLGLLMLSPPVLSAFIEVQTIGRVSPQPAPGRKPTRTDAAMVAGVIDAALVEMDDILAEEADLIWAGGFRYASYLEDARPLGLLLEDDAYRVLVAEVALAGGVKTGEVILALPAQGRGRRPAVDAKAEADLAGPQFTSALGAQVMQVDCTLLAVLGRLSLPLSRVMAIAVGEVLPLPAAALDAVSLETQDGRRLAAGKLGQNRGMRAVKLAQGSARMAPVARKPEADAVAPATTVTPDQLEVWRTAV